jgi:nitrogen regulatory protein PII
MADAPDFMRCLAYRLTHGEEMKRIEMVVEPSALDRLAEAANGLNLSDFDVTEVRRTSCKGHRLYRGREFVSDLVERFKIELNVADDAATRIAHELIETIRPESIAILRLDRTATITDGTAALGLLSRLS